MVLPVLFETPYCKGNDIQDTITLMEIVLMSTKRDVRLQEAKGFVKSTG
jgi:hypothetical protein